MYLFSNPYLFFAYMKFRPLYREIIVSKKSEVVIEGFPRSANTYAVAAFEHAQGRHVKIARHLHAPAQIIKSVQLGKPTMLLIREPRDAVLSLTIRETGLPISLCLKKYLSFYRKVYPHRAGCLIVTFQDVIHNYGSVIEKLNQKFSTMFKIFHHTKEDNAIVFNKIEDMERNYSGAKFNETRVSRPSALRDSIKKEIEVKLETENNKQLLIKCQNIYERMLIGHERV